MQALPLLTEDGLAEKGSQVSKLAEKIRRSMRRQAAAIGFGAAREAPEPTLVLAGAAKDARDAGELARRGADVVVLGSQNSPAKPDGARDVKDVAVGVWIAGSADNESAACREAGCDFVVFDPDRASATALLEENIGYVMRLPRDLSDSDIRALEGFGLDALEVGTIDGPLTVRRQMELRRLQAMTRKPLMAEVQGSISSAELQALRDAGVAVVVGQGADSIEKLRKTIDALPPRSRKREGEERPVPLVPHAGGGEEEHDHDDDDD